MTNVVCECKIGIDWGLSWSPTRFVVKHVAPSGMRGAEPICLYEYSQSVARGAQLLYTLYCASAAVPRGSEVAVEHTTRAFNMSVHVCCVSRLR